MEIMSMQTIYYIKVKGYPFCDCNVKNGVIWEFVICEFYTFHKCDEEACLD